MDYSEGDIPTSELSRHFPNGAANEPCLWVSSTSHMGVAETPLCNIGNALKPFRSQHSATATKSLVRSARVGAGPQASPHVGSTGQQRGFALPGALGPPCPAAYEGRRSCRH